MQGRLYYCFCREPTSGIFVLKILHGQIEGFLNPEKVSICRITGGISSQNLGPK